MSASGWSALLTTITSGISITPAFSAWIESPEPGISASTIVSAWSTMSISPWPTPTVSSRTSSLPEASISSAACSAASARPPSEPRVAIERMNTPGSRKWSASRIRSPSTAPWVNGLEGSIESTPTSRSALRSSRGQRPDQGALADPGRAGEADDPRLAGAREELGDEPVALRVAVLDQADRARQRPLVAGDQALGERVLVSVRRLGHRAAQSRVRAAVIRDRSASSPRNAHAQPALRAAAAGATCGGAADRRRLALGDRRPGVLRQRPADPDRAGAARSASGASSGSATGPRSAATRARS